MFSIILSTTTGLKVHKDKNCVCRKVQHVYTLKKHVRFNLTKAAYIQNLRTKHTADHTV